jgi:hypothetical protein
MELTVDMVNELLIYNRDAGSFRWRNPIYHNQRKGDAGYNKQEGYREIQIKRKGYLVHRLVWLVETGDWPKGVIDHINGNRSDNHFSNLRDVSQRDNLNNTYRHRAGHLVGCRFHKGDKKWQANIEICGRTIFIGNHDTEEEAHQAYCAVYHEWLGTYPQGAELAPAKV